MIEKVETTKEIWVNKFTEESAQEFRERVLAYSQEDPERIIPIYIDSYGGSVFALAKMIETMDEVPNRFVTICQGKAMSCGAILLSHGDARFCGRLSTVLIHNVSSVSWGDVLTMKADSDEVTRLNKMMLGLLADNCQMTYNELQKEIKDATDSKNIILDANGAKKFKIIDHIGTPGFEPVSYTRVNVIPTKLKLDQPKKTKKKKPTPKKSAKNKKTK